MNEANNSKRVAETVGPAIAGNGSATTKPKPVKTRQKAAAKAKNSSKGRRRGRKPYPVIPFEQALRFGQGVAEVGSGHPVKRNTLLEKLNLSINQTTRELITASNKYGITNGSHSAAEFSMTAEGTKAVDSTPSADRSRARIKLAITDVEPFKRLYEKFRGGKMPAVEAMRDTLEDLNEGDRAPCVDIFVQNAKFVGILQTREGAEFFTSAEDAASAPGTAATLTGQSYTSNAHLIPSHSTTKTSEQLTSHLKTSSTSSRRSKPYAAPLHSFRASR